MPARPAEWFDPPLGPVDDVARGAARGAPRWLRLAFPALLVAIALALLGLPQLLRSLPVRPYLPVAGLEGQVSGTFASTGDQMAKLFPYPEKLRSFPAGAAVAGPRVSLLVRARQLSEQRLYYLSTYPDLRPVTVNYRAIDGHTLELKPATSLSPGTYVVTAARDSADAEFDYFYFRVDAGL
jgi:hypothetical protein